MPRTRRGKGTAAPGSSGEMLPKEAATAASTGVVPMVHPGKEAAGSTGEMLQNKSAAAGSTGEMLQKKAATAASSGAVPMVHPGKGAAGSTGEILQKKAAAAASSGMAPTMDPGKGPPGSDSTSEMLQKKASPAAASGGAPAMDLGKRPSGSNSSGEMLQKKAAAAAPSGGMRTMDPGKGTSGSDSSGEMLQTAAAFSGGAPMGALHGNSTAQDREESDANHRTKKPRTISSAKIPHERCTEDEGNMGLSGGMLQKQNQKVDADTGVSGDVLHEHLAEEADTGVGGDVQHRHLAEEADTAKDIEESVSNEIVHVKEEDTEEQEAKRLIKEMNASCIGEEISADEMLGYYDLLPRARPWINLDNKLEDTAMDEQEVTHALYRLRYLKHKYRHQTSKEELVDDKLKSLLDKSEEDCTQEFLEEEGFFRRFEKDMTLDWFIHPVYEECSSLIDYQRLVLKKYGDTEYIDWSEYHKHLRTYKMEKEYVKYCEELSKKLKWMEDYISTDSLVRSYVSTQGVYQAIKIAATDFREITLDLAFNGYDDCKASMVYDATWFKEYVGLYFEIWRLITKKLISFEDALKEVYELNTFPYQDRRIEVALQDDYPMKSMETEYQTCTKAIASGDSEETARKLIAEAVKTLVDKPMTYEQYIRKKIEIASIIGILPPEEDSAE